MRLLKSRRRLLLTFALAAPLAAVLAAPAASQHAADQHDSTPPLAATTGTPVGVVNNASIGFDSVMPPRLDIIRGESVTWTNISARVHTVTADDGAFDSGRLSNGQTFVERFAAVGESPYHCMLHPFIRGVVAVHDLLLDKPTQAAAPNRPFPISGRSALAPGTDVSIQADSGAGFEPVAAAKVTYGGQFATSIVPVTTASYRAVAEDATSDAIALPVLDRVISVSVRRVRGRVRLGVRVTPASSGGRVVLQLYLPQHFGWWPVQTARLGRTSGATFTLRPRGRVRARVRYTLPDGATPLATSRIVRIGTPHAHRHH